MDSSKFQRLLKDSRAPHSRQGVKALMNHHCIQISLDGWHADLLMALSSPLPTQISLAFWHPMPKEEKGMEAQALVAENEDWYKQDKT